MRTQAYCLLSLGGRESAYCQPIAAAPIPRERAKIVPPLEIYRHSVALRLSIAVTLTDTDDDGGEDDQPKSDFQLSVPLSFLKTPAPLLQWTPQPPLSPKTLPTCSKMSTSPLKVLTHSLKHPRPPTYFRAPTTLPDSILWQAWRDSLTTSV